MPIICTIWTDQATSGLLEPFINLRTFLNEKLSCTTALMKEVEDKGCSGNLLIICLDHFSIHFSHFDLKQTFRQKHGTAQKYRLSLVFPQRRKVSISSKAMVLIILTPSFAQGQQRDYLLSLLSLISLMSMDT